MLISTLTVVFKVLILVLRVGGRGGTLVPLSCFQPDIERTRVQCSFTVFMPRIIINNKTIIMLREKRSGP